MLGSKTFPVNIGTQTSIPRSRIKKDKDGRYMLEESVSSGMMRKPGETLETLLHSDLVRRNMSLIEGGVPSYCRKPKSYLVQELHRCGYPDDDTEGGFTRLEELTVEEMAVLLHEAHSTLHLKLWGDHGPIDGKSHVLFLFTIRFHPWQFSQEVSDTDLRSIRKQFEAVVRCVFVCRMSSDLGTTLGAIQAVGREFHEEKVTIDLNKGEGAKQRNITAMLRWSIGDLKWLAGCAMLQCGGNSPETRCLPTSPLPRKSFVDYTRYRH